MRSLIHGIINELRIIHSRIIIRMLCYKISRSGYFDKSFYLAHNPDVADSILDPLEHFLFFGWKEHRDPSARFMTDFYLDFYPEVRQSGLNPVLFHLKSGKSKGWSTNQADLFRTRYGVQDITPDYCKELFTTSGLKPNDKTYADLALIIKSGLFDADWYSGNYPDVRKSGIHPLVHYYLFGWKEKRNPGNSFDTDFYINSNEEVKSAGINPLMHYIRFGKKEGRLPHMIYPVEEESIARADISEISTAHPGTDSMKIAVVCHLYYPEQAQEFLHHFQQIPAMFDLFVTSSQEMRDELQKFFNENLPGHRCIVSGVPNRGRDIAPFIGLLTDRLMTYDVACKVHSKRSGHNQYLQNWRSYLLYQLLGNPSTVSTILSAFATDSQLGMVWPVAHPLLVQLGLDKGWGNSFDHPGNHPVAQKFFPDLPLRKYGDDFHFPSGSMFWFRPAALSYFSSRPLEQKIFEEEQQQVDGTLAHAIERLFGIIVIEAGFTIRQVFFPRKAIQVGLKTPGWLANSQTILFVTQDMFRAGSEIILLTMVRWFRKHTGFRMFLLSIEGNNEKGILFQEFAKEATVFIWNDLCRKHSAAHALQLIKKETGTIDLIYGNTLISAKVYPFLADLHVPVITHVHELEKSIRKQLTHSDIAVFKQITGKYIACSASVEANLRLNHGIASEKIDIVYEFINTDTENETDRTNRRRLLGIPENKTIIWGCGTIDWRKGTDLFIRTAYSLRKQGREDYLFIWIGQNNWDNEQNEWGAWQMHEDFIRENQLADYLLFTGEKEVPSHYFGCGDIFYLPSREDPFPLVCLEAANAGLPLVCFEGAGSMEEFVGTDAGCLAPYLDIESAASAIGKLISDKDLRATLGNFAKNKVKSLYSADIALPAILKICRKALQAPPMVTILVPVYNHASYIGARIESILNQTFRDVEILILDDASSDESYAVACGYASHPAVRVTRNSCNSGSPFGQWKSGINEARGRFIWIAEGDDLADPVFLETLLPFFNNPAINLVYCNSHAIDADDNMIPYYYQKNHYYQNLSFPEERWMQDYISSGEEEIVHALSIRNTIPNVSAVLWRAAAFRETDLDECAKFRNTGDWYAYISILRKGMIGYSASPLNYHRIHSSSVVSVNRATPENTLPDYFAMHRFILTAFDIPDNIQQLMKKGVCEGLRTLWPDLTEDEFAICYPKDEIFKTS